MASSLSPVGAAGFIARFDELTQDPTTQSPIKNPVILIPCGDLFELESAKILLEQQKLCPRHGRSVSAYQTVDVLRELIIARRGEDPGGKGKALVDSLENRVRKKSEGPAPNTAVTALSSKVSSASSSELSSSKEAVVSPLSTDSSPTTRASRRSSLPIPLKTWQAGRPSTNAVPLEILPQPSPSSPGLSSNEWKRLKEKLGVKDEWRNRCSWDFRKKSVDLKLLPAGVNGCRITDLILKRLPRRSLDSDSLTKCLAGVTTLTRLDLSHNHLGAEGIRAIGEGLFLNPLLPLYELILADICDKERDDKKPSLDEGMGKFLAWLSCVRSLKILDLSSNVFDVRFLVKTLRENRQLKLTELDLEKVPFLPQYADALDLLMTSQKGLKKLALSFKGIDETNYTDLLTEEEKNQYLQVMGQARRKGGINYPVSRGGVDLNEQRRRDFIEEQYRLARLQYFSPAQKKVVEQFLSPFPRESVLTDLNLAGSEIGDEGAVLLAKWLTSNTTLQILNLSETQLTVQGIKTVATALSNNQNLPLKELDLGNNLTYLNSPSDGSRTESTASALGLWLMSSKTLRRLRLSRTAPYLARFKRGHVNNLKRLGSRIGGWTEEQKNKLEEQARRDFDQLLSTKDALEVFFLTDAFRQNPHLPLEELSLAGMKIGPRGAGNLARWLEENTTLKRLDLNATALGPEGIKALAAALKGRGLEKLSLRENDLDSPTIKMLQQAFPNSVLRIN